MISHFDHIFCHSPNNQLDETLKRFEEAGFIVSPRKMRHPAGHYNGFIQLTQTYLEVISIVDEDEFQRDASSLDFSSSNRKADLGFQKLYWIYPTEYETKFGASWKPIPSESAKVAATILYSKNLKISIQKMIDAGFCLYQTEEKRAFFKPDLRSGYTFIVDEVEAEHLFSKSNFN